MHNAFHITPVKGLSKPMEGGKWKIVEEFNGNSHDEGGIDLEVSGGYVKRIHSPYDKPDEIAKNGRFWKNVGAAAYGAGEGLLDTLTMGATDQLTDLGYQALQKAGGSSADEIREQNSIRGYGTAAGAITGGILSGGAATGSAIQQGAKGVGAGVSQGSPDSKFAQGVGTYLPLAGSITGMAMGNAGYGGGIKAATQGAEAATAAGDAAKAAQLTSKAAKLSKFSNIADKAGKVTKYSPLIQGASSAIGAMGPQQPLNLGPAQQFIRQATPFISPNMKEGYRQLGEELKGDGVRRRGTGGTEMDEEVSYGGGRGPIQFQQQPVYASDAYNYLRNYGING
jgi:hypothetical protein